MSDLKSKSIHAFKWNVLSQVLNQLLIIGINIFLVRLLSPQDFGLIALPFVVYSFFRMVQDFGYADVMIKDQNEDKGLYSSIYWVIVLGGALSAILFFLLAPFIAMWTNNLESISICRYFALVLVIGSFSIGLEAMMRKQLDFKLPFYVEFFANIIAGIIAIYLAYTGWLWKALVFRFIIHIMLQLAFNLWYSKWRPTFVIDIKRLKPHFSFASISITEQVLNFLQRNVDTLLITRYIGLQPLGIYDRAYRLLLFPLQQVSGSFSKVMFPAFSSIQEDTNRIGQSFLKIAGLISLVTFPMMLGLCVLAEDFIIVVFGTKWLDMKAILQLFCIVSIFQSISTISGSIFSATDNMKPLIKYSLIAKPISIIGIAAAVFIHHDIYYVALYTVILSFVLMIPLWHVLAKCIGIKSVDIWKAILPQLFCTLVMVVVVLIFTFLFKEYSPIFRLLVGTFMGVLTYGIMLLITKNEAKDLFLDLLRKV